MYGRFSITFLLRANASFFPGFGRAQQPACLPLTRGAFAEAWAFLSLKALTFVSRPIWPWRKMSPCLCLCPPIEEESLFCLIVFKNVKTFWWLVKSNFSFYLERKTLFHQLTSFFIPLSAWRNSLCCSQVYSSKPRARTLPPVDILIISNDNQTRIPTFDCVDHNKLWKILKEMGGNTRPPDLPLEKSVYRSGRNS